MANTLLLIGTKPSVVETAKRLGFQIILFQSKGLFRPEALQWADECHVVDLKDTDYMIELAKSIHQRHPVAAAFAFGEDTVRTAACINESLQLVVNPLEAVDLAKDKFRMREVLRTKGLSPIEYRLCYNHDELRKGVNEIGFPLISKPYQGAGSMGIFKLGTERDLQDFLQNHPMEFAEPLLLEQFLIGEEFSVEGISVDGQHQVVAITKKYTTGAPHFVETGHLMPANLTENQEQALKIFTVEILQAIGHRTGPSHTEVILTSDGPRLVETHTRPGGDRIADLIQLSYGIDVFECTMRSARGELKLPLEPMQQAVVAIRFVLLEPGRIVSIDGWDEARKHPNVVDSSLEYGIGDVVPAAIDSLHRHGHLLFRATSEEELVNAIQEVISLINIETTVK